jgi:hypothetical protein
VAIFNYKRRRQPDAGGARDYAFLPSQSLPVEDWFGHGYPVPAAKWAPLQPEQLYYLQAQVMTGLQGVVAGQTALTNLVNDGSTYG